MKKLLISLVSGVLMGTLALTGVRAQNTAQDPPPAVTTPKPAVQTFGINFKERPAVSADAPRLRRTPHIDGVLADGEWDAFYTISSGPIKGTIYCNWDSDYLYIAARTDSPSLLVCDLDAGGDGWLRGADNLELVVGNVGEQSGTTLSARLLDASNSKETPTWNEKVIDPKTILVAGKVVNGTQVVEMAIPKNTASLVLRTGATPGLRVEFLPTGPSSAYTPTQPFEPHLLLDMRLVESRAVAVAGVNPILTLSDYKCVAGQNLFATLELRNQTDTAIPIKSVLWTGQGTSTSAVNTLKEVNVPPIPALRNLKRGYKTLLPNDLVPGSYTLTVTAEMNEGKQTQSSITFAVVEPIQVQMGSEPQPVVIIGQTKLGILVDIQSAVPRGWRGNVELTNFPQGWELEGGRKRTVEIEREDGKKVVRFGFKLPSTTPAGDYPVEGIVTWRGREWKLRTVVQVERTEVTPAPKKP